MSFESIPCNRCGSSLDVAPGARYITCRSCGTALTVQRSSTTTWTESAGGQNADRLDRLEENVQHLSTRSELERLDSEWEREREEYMTTNKYGVKSLPNKNSSVISGIVVGVFGTFWTIMAVSISSHSAAAFADAPAGFGPPPILGIIFPLFGVLFVIGGVSMAVWSYKQAEKYEAARARYETKRRAIEAKLR